MVAGRETEAQNGRSEEDSKHHLINCVNMGVGRPYEQVDAHENEKETSHTMSPNVQCFCMQSKDGPETSFERGERRSMTKMQVVIVL